MLPSRGSTPAGDKAGNGGAKATSQFPDSRGAQTEKGTPNGEATLFLHPPHFDAEDSDGVLNAAANVATNPSLAAFEGAGLRVYTVGTLQPREDNEDYLSNNAAESGPSGSALDAAFSKKSTAGTPSQGDSRAFGISVPHLEQLPASMPRVDKRSSSANNTPIEAGATARDDKSPTPQDRTSSPEGSGNMLRVRRSTFVPGWAVPPRVLLVDDDAVCRKLSSKFLQVFGCAIDVAVDGVNAVNKMNLEKYDLVLMVSGSDLSR